MKKNLLLTITVCLLMSINSFTYAQIIKENEQTNAEYVIELIKISTTEIIYIFPVSDNDKYEKYTSAWFSSISSKNNFLVLKRKDIIHSWNLKNVVFIEKRGGVIKVFLSNTITDRT